MATTTRGLLVRLVAGLCLGGWSLAGAQKSKDTSQVASPPRDISAVPTDLVIPPLGEGEPAAGKRVRQIAPEYTGTEVYHVLYLPTDWERGRRYPVIVEYAGNGNFKNSYGDISTGRVDDSKLGYGISGGEGFLWVCMPYVNSQEKKNQITWWGDVGATVQYCLKAVRRVCEDYGGDPSAVILTGFSRGAIACNYLGLHDDEIADVWLAFIPYSHYDGVRNWSYEGADRASALARLQRLGGRASFICHELNVGPTREYLEASGVRAPYVFQPIAFRNHNDAWALRDIPERAAVRHWLQEILRTRPGTSVISGRITDEKGGPIAGARIQSGYTHWALSGPDGRYEMRGLISGRREVAVSALGRRFDPAVRQVILGAAGLGGVDFRSTGSTP